MSRKRKYFKEYDEKIKKYLDDGLSRKEISQLVNLSKSYTWVICHRLGFKPKNPYRCYEEWEINFLKENYATKGLNYCFENLPNRTKRGISSKALELNIKSARIKEMLPEGCKRCCNCKEILNLDSFSLSYYKGRPHERPYRGSCKKCTNLSRGKWVADKLLDIKWRRKFNIRNMFHGAKERAREKNLEINIDQEWISENFPEKCPVLGTEFKLVDGNRQFSPLSPSLDRIDNNKGYTKNNCIVVSRRVNSIKSNASIDELCRIAEFYKKIQESKKSEENSCF